MLSVDSSGLTTKDSKSTFYYNNGAGGTLVVLHKNQPVTITYGNLNASYLGKKLLVLNFNIQ